MKHQRTLRRVAVALMLLVAFLFQGTWALAGTTGVLSGTVTDAKGAPIAGAVVIAASPSQVATGTTDAAGRFNFLSLSPDTYHVTVSKVGYNTASISGITVFADQTFEVPIHLSKALKTIATVKSTAAGNLLKPGTTASVYSVDSTQMKQVASASGGNNLDTAYSAIYTTPGVTGGIGAFGFDQTFYIRGSSYSQAGYEFDGVPVNRAFDNYNANSLSNVGVADTEIYTGGSAANAPSASLAGYINQTIKTGTYPGYGKMQVTLGAPAYRHGLYVQAGGATPNRLFQYYVGLSGTYYTPNFINNQNGGNLNSDGSNAYGLQGYGSFFNSGSSLYGVNSLFAAQGSARMPLATCGPNGMAPAGASTITAVDDALGLGTAPVCGTYAPLFETMATGFQYGTQTRDTENVINFNFGIPHHKDAGRDSVQLLYDTFGYHTVGLDSINSSGGPGLLQQAYAPWGGATGYANSIFGAAPGSYPVYGGGGSGYDGLCAMLGALSGIFGNQPCATSGGSPLAWGDSLSVPSSVTFNSSAAAAKGVLQTYYFPSSPQNRQPFSGIANNQLAGVWNTGSIVKLQYQKNINENSYLRLYGYTFYSDWLQNDPNGGANGLGLLGIGYAATPDYELNAHTRGVSLQYGNQINNSNLLTLSGIYVASSVTRWYNQQAGLSPGSAPAATLGLPGSSTCYSYTVNAAGGKPIDASYPLNAPAGTPVSCLSVLAGQTLASVNAGALPAVPGTAPAGTSWLFTQNIGADGNKNTVSPDFYTLSLNDEFTPNSKLTVNLGARLESFTYNLGQFNNPEANYWSNVINSTACVDPAGNKQVPGSDLTGGVVSPIASQTGYPGNMTTLPGNPCPVDPLSGHQLYHPGAGGVPAIQLAGVSSITKQTMSPRIGATYTLNPDTLIGFSFGRYVQPTETAFEQVLTYVDGYQTAMAVFNKAYYNYGFSSTVHDNPLQYSNNADLKFQKHLKGTDITFSVSPFYRYTSDQLITVSLGSLAGGFNAATQKSSGVEFAIQKGNPAQNGWSGQLGYTYTRTRAKFSEVGGQNNITVLRSNLDNFLALTKTNNGSPCYWGGVGGTCSTAPPGAPAGAVPVTNPYYSLLPGVTPTSINQEYPVHGWYPTYANYFPNGSAGDASTNISPNVFTGFLAYKRNRFQAAGNFILEEGTRYGSPFAFSGIDPRTCLQNQASAGIVTGSTLADYQSCGNSVSIPNPMTGTFDSIGQYREPWQLNIGAQFTYEFTKKVSGTLVVANLVNRCFGGSKGAWTSIYPANNITCSYGPSGAYLGYTPGEAYNTAGAGYFYGTSPTDPTNGTALSSGLQNFYQSPYAPSAFGGLPLQLYFQVNVKV